MKNKLRNIDWSDFILEIVTIVIGISIAFGVDRWQQKNADANLEYIWLVALDKDLEFNLNQVNMSIRTDSLSLTSMHNIDSLLSLNSENEEQELELNKQAFFSWHWLFTFNARRTAYDVVKFSSGIDKIRNQELLFKLFDIYERYLDLEISVNYHEQMIMSKEIDPIIFEHFNSTIFLDLEIENYFISVERLKAIPDLEKKLNQNKSLTKERLRLTRNIRNETQALITEFKKELKKHGA